MRQRIRHLFIIGVGCLLLPGCVMSEKYEAERARALNFQRLLAQEEKRTGELDSELKRVKREAGELETRNREVTAQLQAVREQLARVQEESAALRQAAAVKAHEEIQKPVPPKNKSTPALKGGVTKLEIPKNELRGQSELPLYHEVKPGDTLFRLARQYGVDVEQIKEWNQLRDDMIEVGQKLVVGYQ